MIDVIDLHTLSSRPNVADLSTFFFPHFSMSPRCSPISQAFESCRNLESRRVVA